MQDNNRPQPAVKLDGKRQVRAIALLTSLCLSVPLPVLAVGEVGAIAQAEEQSDETELTVINGRLDSSSNRMEDGSYYNTHTFEGRVAQSLIIELNSAEFDTYLILLPRQ